MKQYADYDFYQDVFTGTRITDEDVFNRMAIDASYFMDEMCFGRIDQANLTDEIKFACCALADVCHSEVTSGSIGKGIASETVGPHSVSYVGVKELREQIRNEKMEIIRRYLGNTGLLYRGVPSWNS